MVLIYSRLSYIQHFLTRLLVVMLLLVLMIGEAYALQEIDNWIGHMKSSTQEKTYNEIEVIYNLEMNDFPETINGEWEVLKEPQKVRLFSKESSHVFDVTAYKFSLDCGSYPTYKIEERIPPKDWLFATPENTYVQWERLGNSVVKIDNSTLPDYEWQRLYEALGYEILQGKQRIYDKGSDLSHLTKEKIMEIIKKNAIKNVSTIRVWIDEKPKTLFADLSVHSSDLGIELESRSRKFSIHRVYGKNYFNGYDEVRTPYASGVYWDESYQPNQTIFRNRHDKSILSLRTDNNGLDRSLYIHFFGAGTIRTHSFHFGKESCE